MKYYMATKFIVVGFTMMLFITAMPQHQNDSSVKSVPAAASDTQKVQAYADSFLVKAEIKRYKSDTRMRMELIELHLKHLYYQAASNKKKDSAVRERIKKLQ